MSSSSTVTTSDGGNNQLAWWSYTCHECDIIIEILSSSSFSPSHCPICNRIPSFTSWIPFDDYEDDDEQPQFSIPTVEISSSMLCSSSSNDSALSCAICIEDFVVGESAHTLPCNHLYHCDCIIPWLTSHSSCPLCRFELPVAASGDDGGLSRWFDVLALEDNLEEDMRVTLDNLYQSFDDLNSRV